MSLPDAALLEVFLLAELRDVVGRLVGEVRRLHSDNSALQARVDAQQGVARDSLQPCTLREDEALWIEAVSPDGT